MVRPTDMLSSDVVEAFAQLEALVPDSALERAASARWREYGRGGGSDKGDSRLPKELRGAVEILGTVLPALTDTEYDIEELGKCFHEPPAEVLFAWCGASTWRRDVRLAPLLEKASKVPAFRDRVANVARARVVEGPWLDAILCAPLLGDGDALSLPENTEARARLEILIWEAGASGQEVPQLGRWLWGSKNTFQAMISDPAHGALRGRVLAARCLEISVKGIPPNADDELIGNTLRVLQPLILHPEPMVWVHAARALGRLTGAMEQMEGTLLDWVLGESKVLRQRALTAFSSLPGERLKFLGGQLLPIIDSQDEDAYVIASIAAATPFLFFERRDIWDRLAKRIIGGRGGAIAARALAKGLATLWRRGDLHYEIEGTFRTLREMARCARPSTLDDARRWIEVLAVTDVLDNAERDPLDLELGLENLMRIAAQYDDEEADARAARFAVSLAPSFTEAKRIVIGKGSIRHRGAAINALEGCARAFALRLWAPLLATRPNGEPIEEPDLEETWKAIAKSPAEILDLVKENRQSGQSDPNIDLALEVLAIRLGGYALDACGEDTDLGPGRGPTAADTCQWICKIEGLADESRDLPSALQSALSSLFWRIVDLTRGTALGEVDDVEWLGPFAAWWALVIEQPTMLLQLATALPMMSEDALLFCCERAETLRKIVSTGGNDGGWFEDATEALEALHAQSTELSYSLLNLANALGAFSSTSGSKPDLEAHCSELVLAGERLHSALADPVKALHTSEFGMAGEPLSPSDAANAARIAALVARAIRARQLSILDIWFASLGPLASGLLEGAINGAIRRTPPAPPVKKEETKVIQGYELVKPLGEGGIGSVWLVRKPGADRFFVLKIPKAEALASATETEREGILASFVEEAKALAGLYHPNVANIIDRGVSDGAPFLVLEYLIGADLKQYSTAKLLSLFELRQMVIESCAGLAALHGAGLVHRDIKPANLWVRLPLAGGERFDPAKHRDPAHTQPLATVVIDFGMVRAVKVPPEVGGKFVAGTAGYIAPEQVLDPVELDPRADVYSFAGTVYNVTTGRSFFDDISNPRDRIIAHMRRDPFEDAERLKGYPAAIAKLLRAATAKSPQDRPSPIEFSREFAAAL